MYMKPLPNQAFDRVLIYQNSIKPKFGIYFVVSKPYQIYQKSIKSDLVLFHTYQISIKSDSVHIKYLPNWTLFFLWNFVPIKYL